MVSWQVVMRQRLAQIQASKPKPLPPRLDKLRKISEERMLRVALTSSITTAAFTMISYYLVKLSFGLALVIPMMFVASVIVLTTAGYQSRMVVREYLRWLIQNAPRRSVPKVKLPYERRPPVATATCIPCGAQIGERHDRSCSLIPKEWYQTPGQ